MNLPDMAPCGISCKGCNLRYDDRDPAAAEALVGWFRERGWIQPHEGAEEIMKKAPFCTGCRSDEGPHFCGGCVMRTCCAEKGLEHCGQCSDFPCEPYAEWTVDTPHHQAAMDVLLSL